MGKVSGSRVSKEPSFSDNRHIFFNLESAYEEKIWTSNTSRTDWDFFRDEVQRRIQIFLGRYRNAEELGVIVDYFQEALTRSYENNCPLRVQVSEKTVP